MVNLKYKQDTGIYNQKEIVYVSPCGHTQVFKSIAPAVCQQPGCVQTLDKVNNLVGNYSMGDRIKYYAEGTVG